MPIDYRIPDPATGIDLETRYTGTVVPAEVVDYLQHVHLLHSSWEGRRALLCFAPDARASGFGYAAISEIAAVSRTHTDALAGCRFAAVAPRAISFGFLRMYLALRDPPYEYEVFRTREAALDWLLLEVDREAG
ncbi:MAG: hypothetical protein R3E82_00730 [Pseudomonadales bacterium]|nr:hypothetical protein [Pseudomonadales bacterium]